VHVAAILGCGDGDLACITARASDGLTGVGNEVQEDPTNTHPVGPHLDSAGALGTESNTFREQSGPRDDSDGVEELAEREQLAAQFSGSDERTPPADQIRDVSLALAEPCYGRPHLHLEVRDSSNRARKFNPVLLIQADWDNLSLLGSFSRGFEYDLDDPRKWQHLDDQPEAVSGGPLLNDFALLHGIDLYGTHT